MDFLPKLVAKRMPKKLSGGSLSARDSSGSIAFGASRERGPMAQAAGNRVLAGLSIVEVMIALALLATVISALMGSLGSAASANTTADLRERAATASQRLIEQIQAANSLYSIYQTYSAGAFDVPGLTPPSGQTRVLRTYIPASYALSAPTTVAGPMPVLIQARWKSANSPNEVFAISYIAVPR